MATAPTPGEAEVKRRGRQRLIGAITLVLLLVVFVPMALDPEPRANRPEPTLAIPSKENAAPLPAPAQRPAVPAKAPEAVVPPKPTPTPAPAAATAPATAPAKAPEAPAKAPEAKRAPEIAAAPAALPKLVGFAVQVGAFKEDAKLAQAREKLTAAKVSHYTERLATAGGDLTRLRAGPFPTREAAEKASIEVKRAGLDGRVVPLP